MNKQILATLLLLALASAVVAKRPAFIQISRPIMKHTKETPHTHSTDILSKFHAMMNLAQTSQDDDSSSTSNTDDVFGDFLASFRAGVVEEGRAHAEIRAQQVAACAAEGPFRNQEINDAQQALVNAKAQEANCAANQASSESILTVNQLAQAKYNVDLTTGADERNRQNALYTYQAEQYAEVTQHVQDTLKVINGIAVNTQADVSAFAQLGNKVTSILMITMRTGHADLVAPITTMLLQAKTAINPEDVDQLRSLVEALEEALEESQNNADSVENQRAADWTVRQAAIEDVLAKLEDNEAQLKNHIVELSRCDEEEENIAIAAQNKYDRNTDLLAKAQNLCNSYETQWEAAELSRRNQLRMIDALGTAVNEVRSLFPAKFVSLGKALGVAQEQLSGPQADLSGLYNSLTDAEQNGAANDSLKQSDVVLA